MKRLRGYVVGQVTVHGIPTWKVRVQEKDHPLNGKKLKVVSATAELVPGLDVDFLLGTRHNETIAIDVAPRCVKEQGNMRKNLFIAAIALMALMGAVLTAIIFFSPTLIQDLKRRLDSAVMVHRANAVVADLRMATFLDLVPDSVVLTTIGRANDRRWNSWNANTFARHSVFRDRLLGVFDDNEKLYWNGLYATYSGGEWHFQHYGLPVELDQPLKEARRLIMETARDYLRDPSQLEAFYQTKKPLVLDEIGKLSPENQTEIRQWLEGTVTAFRRFNKEDWGNYQAHLAAEKARKESSHRVIEIGVVFWKAENQLIAALLPNSPLAEQIRKRRQDLSFNGDRPVLKKITEEVPVEVAGLFSMYQVSENAWVSAYMYETQMYRAFEKQQEKLWKNTPDTYATLFAGRRFQEGGQLLVDMYIRIADDMIANISAK